MEAVLNVEKEEHKRTAGFPVFPDGCAPLRERKINPLRRFFQRRPPALVFDPDKCTGCGTCEMVCSTRNGSLLSPASAGIKVVRDEFRGKVFAIHCQHCREPLCMEVCPTKAIEKTEEGIVRIDERLCTQCGLCAIACPEAAPLTNPSDHTLHKCDLCGGDPLCVAHCPEGALTYTRGKKLAWIKWLRWPVQIASFLLLVVILVGSYCSLSAGGLRLSCPLGVFQNIASSQTLIVTTLVAGLLFLVLAVLFGRIFCGWVCPLGFVLDLVGKLVPKTWRLPAFLRSRANKYGVLAASVGGSYALGFQAFCTVCPIGTLCRSYGVQGVLRGAELAVIPAVAALEVGGKRRWCRSLCPVGALLALAARVGLIKIVIGANKCKKFSCMRCADVCPMGIIDRRDLGEGKSPQIPMNECILCMRCVDQCPYGAAKIRFRWQKAVPGERE